MDFIAQIKATLDIGQAKKTFESFKSSIQNEKVKIKLDIDSSNFDTSKLKIDGSKLKIKPTVDTSGVDGAASKIKNSMSAQKLQFKIDTGQTISDIAKIEAKLKGLEDSKYLETTEFKNAFDILQKFKTEKLDTNNIDQYNTALKTCQNYIQAASSDMSTMATASQRISLKSNIQKILKENTAYTKDARDELQSYIDEINNLGTSMTKLDSTRISNRVKEISGEMAEQGKTGKSWFDETKRAVGAIATFTGVYSALQGIMQNLPRQMISSVYDIDTAMTNLYKVTEETSAKYNEFLDTAGTKSKALGRDMASYITQVSEWAKLGYSMDSSSRLAEISSIYANVGEVDDTTAVSDLVTVMKAYKMGDSQALNIVDMLNELGNSYATSAGDLGAGLSKMASTMAMSNVSLEKSLAILTGGVEITQDADALGNAIKISVLRLRGQKGALEELGENADDIESVSKMQTQILNMTKGAVNIMESADPTSFRDYYDVMEDIAEVLPKLKPTDQANLIETLFGKNRANQGQAILQAFQSGQIQNALKTAQTAEGSAMKEQTRWLDSMEAKIQQLKASFQELSNVALNSDFLKGIVDSGTGALNVLTQIIDKFGALESLLTIGGGVLGAKGLGLTNYVTNYNYHSLRAYFYKVA